jgi:hypothetical protein
MDCSCLLLAYPKAAFMGVLAVFCFPAVAAVPKVTGAIAAVAFVHIATNNNRVDLTMFLLQSKLSLVSDRRYTVEKLISISD